MTGTLHLKSGDAFFKKGKAESNADGTQKGGRVPSKAIGTFQNLPLSLGITWSTPFSAKKLTYISRTVAGKQMQHLLKDS